MEGFELSSSGNLTLSISLIMLTRTDIDSIKNLITSVYAPIDSKFQSISEECFADSPNLTSVNLEHCTLMSNIGAKAFLNCPNLNSFIFPELSSLKKIQESTFENCYQLSTFPFGNIISCVEIIDNNAFANCSSLAGELVFRGNPKLQKVGIRSFFNCSSLTRIEIVYVDGVELSVESFSNCKSLESIELYLYDGIPSLSFANCDKLYTVSLNQLYGTIEKDSFSQCNNLKILQISQASIPNFACLGLSNFHFLETFQISEKYSFNENPFKITSTDFSGCSKLKSVNILVFQVGTIAENAFIDCKSLETISIRGDFMGEFFIGSKAFSGLINLQSVVIETYDTQKVTLEGNIFQNCISLKKVSFSKDIYRRTTEIPIETFSGCTSLTSVGSFQSLTKIMEGAFSNCIMLESFEANSKLSTIDHRAFQNCKTFKQFNLEGNTVLKIIGDNAFSGCTALEQINTRGCTALQSIGAYAFADCVRLKLFNFTDMTALTEIKEFAFSGCTALEDLPGLSPPTSVGFSVFSNCNNLQCGILADCKDLKWLAGLVANSYLPRRCVRPCGEIEDDESSDLDSILDDGTSEVKDEQTKEEKPPLEEESSGQGGEEDNNDGGSNHGSNNSDVEKTGLIVGVTVGAVVIVIIVTILINFFFFRKSKKKSNPGSSEEEYTYTDSGYYEEDSLEPNV